MKHEINQEKIATYVEEIGQEINISLLIYP